MDSKIQQQSEGTTAYESNPDIHWKAPPSTLYLSLPASYRGQMKLTAKLSKYFYQKILSALSH